MQRHFADFLFATGDVILTVSGDGVRYLLSIHMNVPVRSQAAGNAETHETHDGIISKIRKCLMGLFETYDFWTLSFDFLDGLLR